MLAGAFAPASARRYRVALIGHTGRGAFGHELDLAWKDAPNAEVVAVADPVESGRAKAMARSRAPKGYADYREMLRAEKPDIVAICPRWVDQRVAMAEAALAAGAHLFIEKPIAGSLEDADRIVTTAARAGRKLQVAHTARPTAVSQAVLRMLREGQFGVLMEVRARGKEDRRAGGEDMMVLGTHCFDLMRLYAGDPVSVSATILEKGRPAEPSMEREGTEPVGRIVGDDIAACFRFAGGAPGYFASRRNDVAQSHRFGVTLYGSQATVYLPLWEAPNEPPFLQRGPSWAGGKWERIEYPAGSPQTRDHANHLMAVDLLRAIETGVEPVCSGRDALWTVEMAAGVFRAHYTGTRVTFPLARAGRGGA
jgi:predicted dehydrogenase